MPQRPGRFSTRDTVHPSFARIGLKFSQGLIVGGNNRCLALLNACKDVISDYQPPPQTSLTRTLNNHLKPMIDYIVQCRPLSISMGNAIRLLKRLISSTRDLTDEQARIFLLESINDFIGKKF
jgi:translation initiation factor eIF-2B subunit delta